MLFLGSTSLGQALAMSMLIFENRNLSRKKTQERKLGTTLDFLLKFQLPKISKYHPNLVGQLLVTFFVACNSVKCCNMPKDRSMYSSILKCSRRSPIIEEMWFIMFSITCVLYRRMLFIRLLCELNLTQRHYIHVNSAQVE